MRWCRRRWFTLTCCCKGLSDRNDKLYLSSEMFKELTQNACCSPWLGGCKREIWMNVSNTKLHIPLKVHWMSNYNQQLSDCDEVVISQSPSVNDLSSEHFGTSSRKMLTVCAHTPTSWLTQALHSVSSRDNGSSNLLLWMGCLVFVLLCAVILGTSSESRQSVMAGEW